MKISDYIAAFLAEKGITDVFGYPGGMVTHLMDSFAKNDRIAAHVSYHEQGAAFCACGYGQVSRLPG
jgi:acetolactate synthase-1/2/3 large subunit